MKRGEVWLANLDPVQGSEQAGTRPVLVFQSNSLNTFLRTAIIVPFTTNLRWAQFPHCVSVKANNGGLAVDSVALCHQLRVLDRVRLVRMLGTLSETIMANIETGILVTLEIELH